MRGFNCATCKNRQFGQSASMDIPQGFLDPSNTQYNNVTGSGMGYQATYSGAPSWWDNLSNELSADAENLWNDVESVGVWAGNEVTGFFQDLANPGAIPGNPEQMGYQAGAADRQQYGSVGHAIGNVLGDVTGGIGKALTMPVLLMGGVLLAAILLEDRK